jgi:hypothetical protein
VVTYRGTRTVRNLHNPITNDAMETLFVIVGNPGKGCLRLALCFLGWPGGTAQKTKQKPQTGGRVWRHIHNEHIYGGALGPLRLGGPGPQQQGHKV